MQMTSIECPRCGASHRYFLRDQRVHLRQCPACDGWFVLRGDPSALDDAVVEALDDPTPCPVDGCDATLAADELPQHIIAEHDGEMV